jgi:c-di-GMP-binding flagellar brake protein YcgR
LIDCKLDTIATVAVESQQMSDTASKDEFLSDLAKAESATLTVQLELAADSESLHLHPTSPLSEETFSGTRVELSGVPVSSAPGKSWAASGTFVSPHDIEFDAPAIEPLRERHDRVSRASRRIPDPDCTVRLHHESTPDAIDATCLDISAGGIGLRIEDKVRFASGEPIEIELSFGNAVHELTGVIAHVESGHGTRLGVQFTPMRPSNARAFYEDLNAAVGETLAQVAPTVKTIRRFVDDLKSGETWIVFDVDPAVAGGSLRLSGGIEELLDAVHTVRVETEDQTWKARVVSEGGELLIRQLDRVDAERPNARATGYRAAAPRRASVELHTVADRQEIPARLRDVSRGGAGVVVPGEPALEWEEPVELRMTLPGLLDETFKGRVVHVSFREDEGRSHVGVAFDALRPSQRDTLEQAVTRLEDREVISQVIVFGIVVTVFLIALLVFGSMLTPESPDTTGAPDPAPQTKQ